MELCQFDIMDVRLIIRFFTFGVDFYMTKRTLRGTNYKRIKVSGFRARMSSATGRRVLRLRRKKGRAKISVSS